MGDRDGIFAGDDPFGIVEDWLISAQDAEVNDPNAMALATVDKDGLPNVRIVLLKEIERFGAGAFVFYTNYNSVKSSELVRAEKAASTMHWKSLRRQIRARGAITTTTDAQADAYFASRSLKSRLGAWASDQSKPLASRAALEAALADATKTYGDNPPRPPHWGGFRLIPTEIEFWADGDARLHNRFRWTRGNPNEEWTIQRLNP